MDPVLLAVLSGLFGLVCIGREVYVILRAKRIRICNLFLIMYGVTYGVVLSLMMTLHAAGTYHIDGIYLRLDYSPQGLLRTFWWFLAAVAGYAAFQVGCALRLEGAAKLRLSVLPWTLARSRRGGKTVRRRGGETNLEHLQLTSVICLLLGLACFLIWARGWGGYQNLFLNAAAIRNGSYGVRNSVAFFAKPAQIVATVSVVAAMLIRRRRHTALNVVIFLFAFALSMLYYLAKDGRMVMAMYLLIVLFMWGDLFETQRHIGRRLAWLAALFVVFVAVVLSMDQLLAPLRGKTLSAVDETLLEGMLDELGYIYVAGQTAVGELVTQGSPMLIGHDIGQALFAWLPSALTPDGLIDVWDYNTWLIASGNASAQYPTDLISTSIYDLGYAGPVLIPFAWGVGFHWLEKLFRDRRDPLTAVVYYSLSMTLIRVVNYSNLHYTVAAVFHLFVAAVIYWVVRRIRWK